MQEQEPGQEAQGCSVQVGSSWSIKAPRCSKCWRGTHLLVNTGFGIRNLVEAGDLESICIASLSFIHIISKSQNHLQELLEGTAPEHLLRARANRFKARCPKHIGYGQGFQ